MKKSVKKLSRQSPLFFIIGFVVLVGVVIYVTKASSVSTGLEAESAQKTQTVGVNVDSSASGGASLKFSTAGVPTGVNGNRLGISPGTSYLPAGLTEDQYWDKVKSLGVRWVRIDSAVSNYNILTGIDATLTKLRARNFDVVATITYAYGATGTRADGHGAPADPFAWGGYAGRLADHWNKTFPGTVKAIEIWNEPNSPNFWNPVDPVKYADMLKVSYLTIKGFVPNMIVLSGGTAPGGGNWAAGSGGGVTNPADFIKAIYDRIGSAYFNAVAHHPYESFSPNQTNPPVSKPPGTGYLATWFIRQVMNSYGDNAKQIWGTEAGWTSCYQFPASQSMTEAQRSSRFRGDIKDWLYGQHNSAGATIGFGENSDWNTGPFMIFKAYKVGPDPGLGLIWANNTDCNDGKPTFPGFFEPQVVTDIRSFSATLQTQIGP